MNPAILNAIKIAAMMPKCDIDETPVFSASTCDNVFDRYQDRLDEPVTIEAGNMGWWNIGCTDSCQIFVQPFSHEDDFTIPVGDVLNDAREILSVYASGDEPFVGEVTRGNDVQARRVKIDDPGIC